MSLRIGPLTKIGNRIKSVFRKKRPAFVAVPEDLVLDIDFRLTDDIENNWVVIVLLKGKYAGVTYKYNSVGVEDDPLKGNADQLHMKIDYTVINTQNKSKKELDDNPEFNNTVFNIIYALLQMQLQNADDPQGKINDSGGNDTGKLDSE